MAGTILVVEVPSWRGKDDKVARPMSAEVGKQLRRHVRVGRIECLFKPLSACHCLAGQCIGGDLALPLQRIEARDVLVADQSVAPARLIELHNSALAHHANAVRPAAICHQVYRLLVDQHRRQVDCVEQLVVPMLVRRKLPQVRGRRPLLPVVPAGELPILPLRAAHAQCPVAVSAAIGHSRDVLVVFQAALEGIVLPPMPAI